MDSNEAELNDVSFVPLYPASDFEDAIYALYRRMNKADRARLFWFRPDITFKWFLDFLDDRTILFGGYDSDLQIAGMFMIHNMVEKQSCELGVWGAFSWRGGNAPPMLRRILEYVHDMFKIKTVFVYTPWPHVYLTCERAGMELAATVNDYPIPGRMTSLYILRDDKEV